MESHLIRFRVVLLFTFLIALFLFSYCVWAIVQHNAEHAAKEAEFLNRYAARALSRAQANPDWFKNGTNSFEFKSLINHRAGFEFSYESLIKRFPFLPDINEFENNRIYIQVLKIHSPFKVPDYIMVKPVFVSDAEKYFTYLTVDSRLIQDDASFGLLERLQPAVALALISILILVLIELFHINKVNQTIHSLASWADQLQAGSNVPPPPNLESSKFNYIAYAINKSLSGISDVLEKEQSFARFTSHELRTPIAALSANMEVLELMMKDLSPQERSVLKTMETAVSDMKYQTEALLWLSNEEIDQSGFKECDVVGALNKALADNAYLGKGKTIDVQVVGLKGLTVFNHPVLIQIVLNNLIRNAFQNTFYGFIRAEIMEDGLEISNQNTKDVEAHHNMGFGIGLVLVRKLVDKMNIQYEAKEDKGVWKVRLRF